MVYFEYSTSVVDKVIDELQKAKKYIRIAMFQIHRNDVFELLEKKLKEGVKIEVFTLPPETVKEKIEKIVRKNFGNLKKLGAKIYYCWWNVGSPQRTSTNLYFPDAWFGFHGKFIVTEKSAIALSANFLDEEQLDGLLIFEKNDKQIQLYNKKFDWLIENFSDPSNKIRKLIENSKKYPQEKIPLLLQPDKKVKGKLCEYWIQDYPGEICQEPSSINDGLFISPFDCRARDYLEKLIEESKFAFISSETLTDDDFGKFLTYQSHNGKKIKLLSSGKSSDFQTRTNTLFQNMISLGIDVRVPKRNIHGKLVITDKWVVVSSVNINKMGLGFAKSKAKWRANTETIAVVSDKTVIDEAERQYESEFDNSISFIDLLVEKKKKKAVNDWKNMDTKIDGSKLEHIIREKIEDDAKSYRKYFEKIISHSEKI